MNDQIKAKAILFDMDGVLVDSEAIMCEAAILALREWNVQAAPEDFDDFIGAGEDAYIGGVARRHGVPYTAAMKDRAYAIYAERAMAAGQYVGLALLAGLMGLAFYNDILGLLPR